MSCGTDTVTLMSPKRSDENAGPDEPAAGKPPKGGGPAPAPAPAPKSAREHRRKLAGMVGVPVQKLIRLREERKLSQGKVAEALGTHQTRLAKWETGHGEPNPMDLVVFADYYRVPLRYLCDDTIDDPRDPRAFEANGVAQLPPVYRTLWGMIEHLGAEECLTRVSNGPVPPPQARVSHTETRAAPAPKKPNR
jgi:transcriptional regulator with XRE-family HTH domain